MTPQQSDQDVKSRLRYLLHDSTDPLPSQPSTVVESQPSHSPNPPSLQLHPLSSQYPSTSPSPLTPTPPPSASSPTTPSTSTRLQALNLAGSTSQYNTNNNNNYDNNNNNNNKNQPFSSAFRLPPLPSPTRAHSADSAVVPPISSVFALPPHSVRSDSAISDVTLPYPHNQNNNNNNNNNNNTPLIPRDAASFSSGPSFISIPGQPTVSTSSLTLTDTPPSSTNILPNSPHHLGTHAQHVSPLSSSQGTIPGSNMMHHHHHQTLPTPSNNNMHNAVSALLPSRRSLNSNQSNPNSMMNLSGNNMNTINANNIAMNSSSNNMNTNSNLLNSNARTEAELDKREMRRMKNRISAARSRQRKTDNFETLQRELNEAKTVIEALTRQIDRYNGARDRDHLIGSVGSNNLSAPPAPLVIAVPQDLRPVVGRDFVSVDMLMDVLRVYIRRTSTTTTTNPTGVGVNPGNTSSHRIMMGGNLSNLDT